MQFEITARQHKIACDQPPENGGFDEGMTPCAGYYAAEYLKKHKLAAEGTIVRVSAGKAKNPRRLDDFQIEVEIPLPLCDECRDGLEQAIRHCLIHTTLLTPPHISLAVKGSVLQPA